MSMDLRVQGSLRFGDPSILADHLEELAEMEEVPELFESMTEEGSEGPAPCCRITTSEPPRPTPAG